MDGVIFTIVGYILFRFPPQDINSLYGYRTPKSMQSQKHWDFAQIKSGKLMFALGIIQIILAQLGWIWTPNEFTGVLIGLGILLVVIIYLFITVEKALNQIKI